ncbi:BA14K family protein [Rhizobium sp. G21]|uniref:BA14K family protein n=1 Tax=Rhizobium sp. G21 TaxID=2758439 RepID=UPI0015FF6659|nr:BA14K family protein [Rhizobium sp. G21]MBB1248951.1 BA14K family protein [Rhizobium sp. G21]
MPNLSKFIIAGVLALAGAAPVTIAEAQPSMQPLQVEKTTDVTKARVVCNRWNCRRVYRPGPRVVIRPRYYRPRTVYVAPRVIVRPAPRVIVRTGGNAHVRWCLNRYQSYNPATNRFLAYDGYYKVCRSPYR